MKEKFPFLSLILSAVCILLFCIHLSEYSLISMYFKLSVTLFVFLFGLYSMSGVRNWQGMVMSSATIFVTLGLSCIYIFVIFIGRITII